VDLRREFESLRFGGPGAKGTLQFANPDAKLIGATAFLGELSPHYLGLGGFAVQPITQLLILFVITSDVIPQERGLRSQRRELAVERRDIVGGSIFLGFEREQRRGLFAELELESADCLAFPAYLSGLAGGLGFQPLDIQFEPAHQHGEFGA
jgi:hypothetical protein